MFENYLTQSAFEQLTWFQIFKSAALSVYQWDDLPAGCDARMIELSCFYNPGYSIVFDDKQKGTFSLPATPSKQLNIYGYPLQFQPYSMFGTPVDYKPFEYVNLEDVILIMNNDICMPTLPIVAKYAQMLEEIEKTQNVNIKQLKNPVFYSGVEKSKESLKNLWNAYDGGAPIIYTKPTLNIDSAIQYKQIVSPSIVNDTQMFKATIIKEFFTQIGIPQVEEKKERKITSEANSEMSVAIMNGLKGLKTRQQAAKQMSEKYGTNTTCKIADFIADLYEGSKLNENISVTQQSDE